MSATGGNGNGFASPMTYDAPKCEGWYNTAADVCDSAGD
jgi:hypothetical protein